MKVEFLKNLGLDDDVIKQIQAESGKDITATKTSMQSQIDSLTGQVTDLQTQVGQRDASISEINEQLAKAGQSSTKLGEVQKSLTELQEKYNKETADYKTKLADQAYEFKVTQRADKIDFSCGAAKREFVNKLMQNRLTLSDGELMGFDDYVNQQRASDPDAFKPIKEEPPKDNEQKPNFAPPTNPQNQTPPPTPGADFGFNFIGVRKHD